MWQGVRTISLIGLVSALTITAIIVLRIVAPLIIDRVLWVRVYEGPLRTDAPYSWTWLLRRDYKRLARARMADDFLARGGYRAILRCPKLGISC